MSQQKSNTATLLQPLYQYHALVTDVYDGDSITVDIDLGLGVWVRKSKLRLKDIDAPELRGPDREVGLAARDAVRAMIMGKKVLIEMHKDKKGKYGRYIALVFFALGEEILEVTEQLVSSGLATPHDY